MFRVLLDVAPVAVLVSVFDPVAVAVPVGAPLLVAADWTMGARAIEGDSESNRYTE